jgi:hypothetical protein
MLPGRELERGAPARLLGDARSRRSGALVLLPEMAVEEPLLCGGDASALPIAAGRKLAPLDARLARDIDSCLQLAHVLPTDAGEP